MLGTSGSFLSCVEGYLACGRAGVSAGPAAVPPALTMAHEKKRSLSVFCGSWNMHAVAVGKKLDPSQLSHWLVPGHDVYAVSTQEAERSIFRSVMLTSAKPRWESALRSIFADEYAVLATRSCGAVHLALIVRLALVARVTRVRTASVSAGFLCGMVNNKGAVGIACNIGPTSFLFVSAHLSPHASESAVAHRDWQHERIDRSLHRLLAASAANDGRGVAHALRRACCCARGGETAAELPAPDEPSRLTADEEEPTGGSALSEPVASASFDIVFWMGDLNYRVDISKQEMLGLLKVAVTPPDSSFTAHRLVFTPASSCTARPSLLVLHSQPALRTRSQALDATDFSSQSEDEHSAASRAAQQRLLEADQLTSTQRPTAPILAGAINPHDLHTISIRSPYDLHTISVRSP